MRASLATPEVRTVPTCSDISENAHALLAFLTRNSGQNKGTPRVKGDQSSWAVALGMTSTTLRHAYEEIGPEGEVPGALGFLSRDGYGRLVLWLACECPAGKKTDSSIPLSGRETESKARSGAHELAPRVSFPAACGRKSDPEKSDETPGQDPETFFLNGAVERPKKAPARRPGPDSAYGLAEYFADKIVLAAQKQGIRLLPAAVNRRMMARHTKMLLADGMSPDEIRGFIDHFAKGYRRYHKPGVDPGKVFLARRRGLYEEFRKAKTFTTERDINKILANGRRYTTLDDIRRKKTS